MLSSGDHEIKFCVACDEDDEPTKLALRDLRQSLPIFVRVGPRPDTLGSIANDLAEHWPADVYQIWADDLVCATYGWDKNVAEAVEKTPHGVFWMRSARTDESLVPAITETWRKAAGSIFTEHFPFWYDDLWLYELWVMATDADPIYLENVVVDKPSHTHRMRELDFWANFYYSMRHERVRHGREIATKLGLPVPIISAELARQLDLRAEPFSREYAAKIEVGNQAETGEPSEAYKRMKEKAQNLMKKAA